MIHSSSIVEEGVLLGDGVKIWQWCHIEERVEIGEGTSIGQGCYVGKGVKIGKWCRIQNGVNIFSGVTIGNFVFIGPGACFTNVRHVSTNKAVKYDQTRVDSFSCIGANATIIAPCIIHEGSLVGAGSVVTKDVPALATVYGNPARER